MTVPSQAEIDRKRRFLYLGPGERHDTCRRCWYSTVTVQGAAGDKSFRCNVVAGDVRAGGCCAAWRPMSRPAIELRPVEYAQAAEEPQPQPQPKAKAKAKAKAPAERKARPAPTKRKPSGIGATGAGHPWRRA